MKSIHSIIIGALLFIPSASLAHPGGTDGKNGHRCLKNCESYGLQQSEYHYHDGDGNIVKTYDNNSTIYDKALAQRLHGKILLQVEERGEAYYIRSKDYIRYYMKNGEVAYNMMRYFSLGIMNADLDMIPAVSDTNEMKAASSICKSNQLANRLRGEILLQVQSHGEAWYVDPEKCRRIYMKNGEAAYQIMRFLGLGILNTDLKKIPTGVTEFSK